MAKARPTIGEKEPIEITYRPSSDFETIFANAKSKIENHFAHIHSAATELESILLAELEQCINTHRDIVIQVNDDIDLVKKTLNSATDAQLKTNLQMELTKLAIQKYVNIDVTFEDKLLDFMNRSISIDILMTSDTNIEKIRSPNPHPVIQYRKAVNMHTFHKQLNEIKTLLVEPEYLKQGKMWYLIGRNWVEQWLNHEKYVKPVDGLIPIPPPIDNSDIMDDERSRKLGFFREYSTIYVHTDNEFITEELVLGRDFAIFNEVAWGKLVEWYGMKEGTIEFQRIVNDIDTLHTRNISLCLYPKSTIAKFQIYNNNLYDQFNYENKIIELFNHDTEPQKLTAIKIAFKIPLSFEIIIFREENSGTCIHPITKKKYKVISSIVSSYNCDSIFSRFKDVPNYLVTLKSKEIWWLRV